MLVYVHGLRVLKIADFLGIPSDADRIQDIPGSMKRLEVNYAHFTPSVAHLVREMTCEMQRPRSSYNGIFIQQPYPLFL